MAYLKIHGWTIKLARAAPVELSKVAFGRQRTGLTGFKTSTELVPKKSEWTCSTVPMIAEEAEALEQMLQGTQHVWDFVGSVASGGAAGMRQHAATAARPFNFIFTGGPFSDVSYLRVVSSYYIDLQTPLIDAGTGTPWTILAVRRPVAGAFHAYVFRSAGNYWYDGVLQGSMTLPWLAKQTNGDVRLSGLTDAGANANNDIAQLVVAPYEVPDAVIPTLGAWVTRRWGSSPILDVSGDFIPQTYALCNAALKQATLRKATTAGTYAANMRSVSFTLREV